MKTRSESCSGRSWGSQPAALGTPERDGPGDRAHVHGSAKYRFTISDFDNMKSEPVREFFHGFVSVHILHHAAGGGFYGTEIMDELGRHGYRLGPGTLYPLLHRLERDGCLTSKPRVEGGRRRIYYEITPKGAKLLRAASEKVRELVSEVLDEQRKGY